jgi:hypothetical protein
VPPAYIMPSPEINLQNNGYAKALESFTYLRPAPVSSLLAVRDLVYAHFQLEAEHQFIENEKINNVLYKRVGHIYELDSLHVYLHIIIYFSQNASTKHNLINTTRRPNSSCNRYYPKRLFHKY